MYFFDDVLSVASYACACDDDCAQTYDCVRCDD